jgi:hypothetical protein
MRLGLWIAATGFCAAAAAQTAWHTLAGPERKFFVELPAAPQYLQEPMKAGTGESYAMHQYLLERADTAYVVQTATYPPSVDVSSPRGNLQAGLDNAAKGMDGGAFSEIKWLTHQGLTAVEALGMRNAFAIRSYSVLAGRQMITLTYAGPRGSARSADADRFVNSLSLAR